MQRLSRSRSRLKLRASPSCRLYLSSFEKSFLRDKRDANFEQLSPLSPFLRTVFQTPSKIAYIHGQEKTTWGTVGKRVAAFSHALVTKLGVKRGDVVSIIAPNSPSIFEAHFAVPGAGAVLHCINTRLDAKTVAYQLTHSGSKVVFVDAEFDQVLLEAKAILEDERKGSKSESKSDIPVFIGIQDKLFTKSYAGQSMSRSTEWSFDYEDLIANGNETFPLMPCTDEFSAIALSYTSGTTGNPKGVVGNYRGAYLNALGNLFDLGIPSASQIASSSLSSTAFNPSYLWIVPMFHCNGWCFVWSLGMSGTTSIFMRQIRAETLFHSIEVRALLSYMRFTRQL